MCLGCVEVSRGIEKKRGGGRLRTLFPSAVECLHACSCLERLLTAPRSWQETTCCLHWADKKEATEEGGERRRRSEVVVGREGGREGMGGVL